MTRREDEMRERIYSLEGQLVKAAIMLTEARERAEAAEDKLLTIRQWCEAYPLNVFPEPNHKRTRELLEAGGQTLDAVSASAMRHVLTRLKEEAKP